MPEAIVVQVPLSDGGEGQVECVRQMLPTRSVSVGLHGPLMKPIEEQYALSADGTTAYMEMAAASGLTLVPSSPTQSSQHHNLCVVEMMADAVKRGCQTIVMGIGGSATCDGGRGMIEAMRAKGCLDMKCRVIVACNVNNPLYGENGAAYVFAPQNGASSEQVATLDRQLRAFARQTEQAGYATPELAFRPGAGAAGGLGYALLAYLDAQLHSGIDIMLELANFDTLIHDADLVITGEGKSDEQTLMGKVPQGVLNRCARANVPVWLLSGMIDDTTGRLSEEFDIVSSINDADNRPLHVLMQPEVAIQNLKQKVMQLITNA